MLRRVALTFVVSLVASCTHRLEVQVISQPDHGPLAARADGCGPRWYATDDAVAASCTEIGDVFVGDTGWTYDCGADRVREEVRRQACLFGADAVQVIREREPSLLGSSCEQIRARFLRCAADGAEPGR